MGTWPASSITDQLADVGVRNVQELDAGPLRQHRHRDMLRRTDA